MTLQILLRQDFVQQRIAGAVTVELEGLLHTQVTLSRIGLDFPNRLLIAGITVRDRSGAPCFTARRVSAYLDMMALLKGKIYIHNVTLTSPHLSLRRRDSSSPMNIQFIVDALTQSDSTKKPSKIHLRINQVIVTQGTLSYNVMSDTAKAASLLDPSHLLLNHIQANVAIKGADGDSLNLNIRKLALAEKSGLCIKKLSVKFTGNRHRCNAGDFILELPGSRICFDELRALLPDTLKASTLDRIELTGRFTTSTLTPADVSSVIPLLKNFRSPLWLAGSFGGNLNGMELYGGSITSEEGEVALRGNVQVKNMLNGKPVLFMGDLERLSIDSVGYNYIARNMNSDLFTLPPFLERLGATRFTGKIATGGGATIADGNLRCQAGSARGAFSYSHEGNFKGSVTADSVAMGRLTDNSDLGGCSFVVDMEGNYRDAQHYSSKVAGTIKEISCMGYTYHALSINGNFDPAGWTGEAAIADPNARAALNFACDLGANPSYHCEATIDSLYPGRLHLTEGAKENRFSWSLLLDIQGNDPDAMTARLKLQDFTLKTQEKEFTLPLLTLNAGHDGKKKSIMMSSDIARGTLTGYYSYKSLWASVMQMLATHLPSLFSLPQSRPQNTFAWNMEIENSEILSSLLNLPVVIKSHSALHGQCNDANGTFVVSGDLNDVSMGEDNFKKIDLLVVNSTHNLQCNINGVRLMPMDKDVATSVDDSMDMHLVTAAGDDKLHTLVRWKNRHAPAYGGDIDMSTTFDKNQEGKTTADAFIKMNDLLINDTLWTVSPFNLQWDGRGVDLDGFYAHHSDQYLNMAGRVGPGADDKLVVDMKKVELSYLFDIVRFHPVSLDGEATGKVVVGRLLGSPSMKADLKVNSFAFEHGIIGDLDFNGSWDEEAKAIRLKGDIAGKEESRTLINGFVSPANDTINIGITAHKTNIDFLNYLLSGILYDTKGTADGRLNVLGGMHSINLEGALAPHARVKIAQLGVPYELRGDTIRFIHNEIAFHAIPIYDREGHRGTLSGGVHHHNLKRFSCDFSTNVDNLLVYTSPDFGTNTFYGTTFVTGNANIQGGGGRGLRVQANVRTNRGSSFVYNAGGPEGIVGNEFITFTDRKKRASDIAGRSDSTALSPEEITSSLNIDLYIDCTPDLTLKVIMNPLTGDCFTAAGSGVLHAVYDAKEGFQMKGNLGLDRGSYKFTLQSLFPKEFVISPGSNISFNGDPFKADLGLKTVYTVNSASLNDLSNDVASQKNNVKVNCLMDITGTLENTKLKFGLELPDGNEEEKDLLAEATGTEEQMNMQFIYLLGIGKFYTYDYNNSNNTNTRSSSAVESLISSSISGQLNHMLSQIIDNDNWNLSGNFTSNEKGWNSMEIEGMLSGRLLNNRLLVNGNFGYRDNPMNNTNFIGDFEVQWLLNRSGTVSLKGYNKTNDRYFSKTSLTTQGAGILLKKDFDGWNPFKKVKGEGQ